VWVGARQHQVMTWRECRRARPKLTCQATRFVKSRCKTRTWDSSQQHVRSANLYGEVGDTHTHTHAHTHTHTHHHHHHHHTTTTNCGVPGHQTRSPPPRHLRQVRQHDQIPRCHCPGGARIWHQHQRAVEMRGGMVRRWSLTKRHGLDPRGPLCWAGGCHGGRVRTWGPQGFGEL